MMVRSSFSGLLVAAMTLLLVSGCTTRESGLEDATGYVVRGSINFGKGHYDQAIADYSKAIELNPDYAPAYNSRGHAYSGKGLYDRAVADLTKAIELKPDFAFAYYNRGFAYDKKSLLDQAIVDYSKAIELNPGLAIAYLDRGVAYSKKGLHDQAIADYSKAIELKPDYALPYYNRGLAYKIKGQYDRAIRDYTEAIRLKPDYAIAYNNRGVVYSFKGQYDQANQDYTEAIRLLKMEDDKHRLAVAHTSRGVSFQERGSYDRAITDLNKAIELKPDYAHAYGHLAWVFATSPDAVFRNGKRAVELAERAVELDRDAHNLDALAAAYAEVGRFEEAISTQLQAIDLPKKKGDESSAANFNKHLERYRTNKPWRMNEHEGGPDHPTTATKLNNLAELYRAQGKYAEAEPLHKRALAIREKARQQEEARKREKQQRLEALSGRYVTAGGQSQWDIRFRGNRFEARYLFKGKWGLLYDGNVTGTRISGRVHHGSSSICRQSPTTPLNGSVDLRQKSIEINYGDYNLVEMRRHKRCVPITTQRKWTQGDRQ